MDEDNRIIQYAPVSVFEWLVTMIVLCIPLLNIIMLLMWAFTEGTNPTKANFAKAALIWILIGIAFSLLFIISISSVLPDFSDMINL